MKNRDEMKKISERGEVMRSGMMEEEMTDVRREVKVDDLDEVEDVRVVMEVLRRKDLVVGRLHQAAVAAEVLVMPVEAVSLSVAVEEIVHAEEVVAQHHHTQHVAPVTLQGEDVDLAEQVEEEDYLTTHPIHVGEDMEKTVM